MSIAPARARTRRIVSLVVIGAAVVNVGWTDPPASSPAPTARGPIHVYKSKTQRDLEAKTAPEGPPVVFDKPGRAVYYGGEVISNVNVVPVFWSSAVSASTQSQIGAFLTAITASPYLDWLEEYDTIGLTGAADGFPGTSQHIGRGTATAPVTITPMNMATTLADLDIQKELIAQLASGALPAPTTDAKGHVNSLYMIEFPDAFSITEEGHSSCSYFCGYHFTLTYGKLTVPYAVMPGIGSCGSCGSGFGWVTSIHSHELMEAISDMEVGLVTSSTDARPLGWYDPTDGPMGMELADICDPFGSAPGVKGGTAMVAGYTVQLIWSNFAGVCVAEIPICAGTATQPSCRPCTVYDEGVGCTGATPVCQTSTTTANAGQCVGCVADSTCAAPKPRCDLTTNVCVACLSNLDCSGNTPTCDPTTTTCRGCKTNADCDNGQVCDASSDAEAGSCVDCNTDADCTFGACEKATHTCGAPPAVADAGRDAGHDAGHGDGGHEAGGKPHDAGTPVPSPGGGCACRAAPRATTDERGAGAWSGWLVAVGFAVRAGRRRAGTGRTRTSPLPR